MMRLNGILVVLVVVLSASCCCASLMVGSASLSFMASGGKLKLTIGHSMFSLRLVKLQEMKNTTHMVVENSTQKHKYEGFHNVVFTAGTAEDKNATATAPAYKANSLEAIVSLSKDNDKNITIKLNAILAEGNGTIDLPPYTITALRGQASAAFEIRGWKFCKGTTNECNNNGTLETGEYLDATFEVESNAAGAISKPSALTAKFGTATITYSNQIFVDGISEAQKADYPKFSIMSNKLHMIIRIPNFNTKAEYGTLDVKLGMTSPTSGTGKLASGFASFLTVFFAVLLF